MFKFLNSRRRRKQVRELAPQLTAWQRKAMEQAAVPPGGLPYAAYDEMERDSMVQTCLTVKKLGVLASEWRVVGTGDGSREPSADRGDEPTRALRDASGDMGKRADFVMEAFQRMEGSPHTILLQAMDAFAKGWSVQETVYEPGDGRLWIKAVRPKDPSLFGLDVDAYARVRGLRLQLPGEAEREVPRFKFVLFAHRGSYGKAKGKSDLDAAYRHWSAKQSLLSAWKFHLERFAMPTVLGRFERGLSVDEQTQLLGTMQNLSQHAAVIFPNEIEIDTLGGQKEASAGFMEAIDFHNREIARSILGQTLTTDEGRRVGSLAMGKVHLQVLLLQLEALRRELADVVMTEQVIRPLVELNFGPGPIPRFEFVSSPASVFATGELMEAT